MEQSDVVQMQVLQLEEIPTDIDGQTIQIVNQDVKAATSMEGGQDSPKAYRPPLETTLVAEDTDIDVEVATDDYLNASHIDVSVKDIDSNAGHNNRVEPELNQPETKIYTSDQEQIVYEHVKENTIDSNHELQHLCTEEDQSQNVITESKIEAKQDEIDILESDCNIVGDANQSDTIDKQCLTLDESRLSQHSGGQIHDTHESVKETIREIHDNDSNQNSSIVTDAELIKLEQEGEEEVVVVVETIEPTTTDTAADNFIVTVDEKDVNKDCNQETVVTLQAKKLSKSRHEDNKIDLIDYSQESDDTIIEVTEVIDAPVTTEQYEQQDNKNCVENNEYHIESVKLTDEKIPIHKDITENIQSEVIDRETLISSNNKDDITIIIDEKIIITEDEVTADQPQIENAHEDNENITEHKQDDTPAREISVVSSKKRSVIQDIIDDWGVENADEDAQSTSKVHDSVEIELKSLLDETKSDQIVTNETLQDKTPSANKEYVPDEMHNVDISEKNIKHSTERTENQKKNKVINQDAAVPLNRSGKNSPIIAKSSRSALNKTPQSHVTTSLPKNRSRHLTSQIASPAEVTEVLKERLREKQKTVVDTPRGPDIFFVKKITQRLSNKLAGSSVNPVPGLIPLPQQTTPSSSPSAASQSMIDNCDKKVANATAETSKDGSNSDNKELLAILEGDVDPDWSILKPPTLTEEGKTPPNVETQSDHSAPPKLDPLIEREMALKQLLELPVTSSKKIPSRKKKTFRAAPGKVSKDVENPLPQEKELASMDSASENAQPNTKPAEINLCSPQKSDQKDHKIEKVSTREESRSGRKRKPTEKAREHEQNTIKRQKVYKGKVSLSKKQTQENISNSSIENHVVASDAPTDAVNNEKTVAKEVANKQVEDKTDPISSKVESSRPKPSLPKKGSQAIAKRNIVVKRLLRQKIPANEKPVALKDKLTPSPKKSSPKAVTKSQKRTAETALGDPKPKKKIINEIDRLLQDEGVVNLLYDVEQPDKKRLVPITKSRTKVMDLQKVQRELKIRKKLVRNAVLRLRTSTVAGVTKVSPRSKRTSNHPTDVQADNKKVGEQLGSPKGAASSMEFILPAKIRNAADASIIIRRHSSSSFSSASGSPRVSVDAPEKPAEVAKTDDGAVHSLRSAKKRRDSQDEKINNAKKSKKKTVQRSDAEPVAAVPTGTISTTPTTTTISNAVANNADEKTVAPRPNKKSEIKKIDKTSKQQENVHAFEDHVSSKVTTRSSNAVTGKVTAKSKRAVKSKVTFVKADDSDNAENSKEEDELSACLAEAATALSVVNTGGRSGNVATTRKNKANASKTDVDSNKTKVETQGQFSNKEINVRRHGNLVQLILTPSSSTKIRNALTLQVMQEFREALSILKRDDECRVVLFTSTGTSFCEGLDLSALMQTTKEERRSAAQELANAVKEFIKSLATFNKPIVAGVQGAAIGLGVTMLPLFDLVIASDKATFCTPYGKLGQIAEGAAVFTLSHILGSAITSELLLGGRTLTASEALRAGLVTRVLWPDRFQVELLPSLRAMSDQSSQSMEATKALLRHSLRKKLDAALESETYLLIQHWCSVECQTAIKAYIDGKIQ
ncbi:microtubule-associated protein futsch-like [Nylanderia fulva]|uniref:microtubule-associated protein futsch-like n=1 Tax=Nylanderia fulva TaxID=613905 RepID=UPI0010FB2D1D|nr:microtubule-associated protein futsch-like [Nylanderia fulva]XP_029157843.1 microtubule-associated protein futsch-like [Nylanderia fulva]XP_029157850.1 microtubule-associated protein futsch-like [Nylanderia fulva]